MRKGHFLLLETHVPVRKQRNKNNFMSMNISSCKELLFYVSIGLIWWTYRAVNQMSTEEREDESRSYQCTRVWKMKCDRFCIDPPTYFGVKLNKHDLTRCYHHNYVATSSHLDNVTITSATCVLLSNSFLLMEIIYAFKNKFFYLSSCLNGCD